LSQWEEILLDIDERLFPHFDLNVHERCLYYHLISQTHVRGRQEATIPLQVLVEALGFSAFTVRKAIRSLAKKGIIDLSQSRAGHFVRPKLPAELGLPERESTRIQSPNIDEIDFYTGRKYLTALITREGGKCFYCLRALSEESCELDHVVSQMSGGDNGYKNIVASCHSCNTRKQSIAADDFLRNLLRGGLLNDEEFSDRLDALEALQDGKLVPQVTFD